MQKFILFDFDGVIVDSFEPAFEVSKKACPHLTADEYKRGFEGNINDWKGAVSKHTEQCRTDIDFFTEYVPKMKDIGLVPGIKDVIKQLAESNTLIIVSSTITMPIKELMDRTGLAHYFTDILGNDIHKSKVEKIKMIFQKYQTTADNCVFITDTLGDLREAEKAGVGAIAVSWGFHSHETLQRGAPMKIIDSPKNLLATIDSYFA